MMPMVLGAMAMIELFFERDRRVLMVRYGNGKDLILANIQELDEMVKLFVEREGTADTLVDFSHFHGRVCAPDLVARAKNQPTLMAAHKRVIVAPQDVTFGTMRAYCTHLELKGEVSPLVVRTIAEAYGFLELEKPQFEPYDVARVNA
jgi:hypothetical protein